jgi:glycerol kinase
MYARACLVGLTRGSNRAHLARAVLESIAFEVADLLAAMKNDAAIPLRELRVDGGASVSNVMMQFQADLLEIPVNRPKLTESTALGAAYLAGLAVGFWKNTGEISSVREVDRLFTPVMQEQTRSGLFAGWERAVERSRNWAEK